MPPTSRTDPTDVPGLAEALSRLAEALTADRSAVRDVPSQLDMAVLAEQISGQLHELARLFIAASREQDGSSWADVGDAFGVTRQAAMRRWTI